MAKATHNIPADKLALYDALITAHPEIERKGKTMPYTSHNGYMFSFLDKEGKMGLRHSPEDREDFIKKHQTGLMEQHGRIMKDFVEVPDKLLRDTPALSTYLLNSLSYTGSLKAKPGKKKK